MSPRAAAGDAVHAEADLAGNVLEGPVDHGSGVRFGGEVERPIAGALADLHQEPVLAGLELEHELVLIGLAGPLNVLRQELFAVEPDGERVVAAQRDRQVHRLAAFDLAVEVNHGIGVVFGLEKGEVVDGSILELAFAPDRRLAAFAGVLLGQVDFLFGRIGGREALLAGVIEGAGVVPFAQLQRASPGVDRAFVAVEVQAVEAGGQEDVGPAVAVVVDPGSRGHVADGLARQQMAVVAEDALAQVGVELRSGRCGQQQVGLAVAVIVGPDRGTGAGPARQRHLVERFAAVLQQADSAGADQAQVRLAVAVEIDGADAQRFRIDAAQGRVMGEARHPGHAAEVLAAPADEIALRVVVLQLEADFEPLDAGTAQVQVFQVAVDHAGHDRFLAGQDLPHGRDQLIGRAGVGAEQVRLAVAHGPPLAAGIRLVPVFAGEGLAGVALVEEHADAARLDAVHGEFRLARIETRACRRCA